MTISLLTLPRLKVILIYSVVMSVSWKIYYIVMKAGALCSAYSPILSVLLKFGDNRIPHENKVVALE